MPAEHSSERVLQGSLLFFVLFPVGAWLLRPLTLGVACAGLLDPRVRQSSLAWWTLAGLAAARVVEAWPLQDNHAYLLVYWCLAIALSRRAPDAPAALARSARPLLAAVFALASLWKLAWSDDYLDTTFFRVLLIGDERFEEFALLVSGLGMEQLDALRGMLEPGSRLASSSSEMLEPGVLRAWAGALTWTSLGVEMGIALAYTLPLRAHLQGLRDGLLMIFCVATYALAPFVSGFGWLLLVMGLASCPQQRRGGWTMAYYVCLAALLLEQYVPWAGLLREAL